MALDNDFEFDWDDEIQTDSEYILLEEGDYDFSVKNFERTISQKGHKTAKLTLTVTDGSKSATVFDTISLLKTSEWKISEFFRSIGLKKHGEKLKMRWNDVVGLSGRCSIYVDTYEGKKRNKIKNYLDPVQDEDEFKW